MKRILFVLLAVLMLLCTCAPVQTDSPHAEEDAVSSALDADSSDPTPDPTVEPVESKMEKFSDQATRQEAMEAFLRQAESLGYETIVRDALPMPEEDIPCTWILAVNDLGETAEVLMMDKTDAERFYEVMNAHMDMVNLPIKYPLLSDISIRAQELGKFTRDIEMDICYGGAGVGFVSMHPTVFKGDFLWCFGGSPFAHVDFGTGTAQFHWKGKDQVLSRRPDDLNLTPGWLSDRTMEESVDALIGNLQSSGFSYTVEEKKETVTLDGTAYEVTRVKAKNADLEYLDILFCEDPDFCYEMIVHEDFLHQDNEENAAAWKEKYNPGWEYLIQGNPVSGDRFYHGYSFYGIGSPYALIDAGSLDFPSALFEVNGELFTCSVKDRNTVYDVGQQKFIPFPG